MLPKRMKAWQKDTLCCLAGWKENCLRQTLRALKDTSWIIQQVSCRTVAMQLQLSFFQQLAPCNGEGDGDSQKFLPENGPPQFEMLYSYPEEHSSPPDADIESIFTHQLDLEHWRSNEGTFIGTLQWRLTFLVCELLAWQRCASHLIQSELYLNDYRGLYPHSLFFWFSTCMYVCIVASKRL